MLINQDLNQTQAPSPQQAIKSYGRPGSPKRLVGVPVAARSTQPYRVTLQAFAVVERVQAFQRVEVGWSQTCGHTSRRQLLAAEIVLTSTRVIAFDRTATADVSMLGSGAQLTLATRSARERSTAGSRLTMAPKDRSSSNELDLFRLTYRQSSGRLCGQALIGDPLGA